MQSNNRLILWGSFVALTLCAVPYGCAGKAIGGGDTSGSGDPTDTRQGPPVEVDGAYRTSDGNVVGSGSGMIGGTGFGIDGAYRGSGDGVYQGVDGSFIDGGDGALIYFDGSCDCADGENIDYADGWAGDGWDEQSDGQKPADADGSPG